MSLLLNLAAIVSLIAGLVASQVVKTDIRIEVVATCWIGGFLLVGLAGILSRIQRIEKRLEMLTGQTIAPFVPNVGPQHQKASGETE